jgi:hypothetical protein
MTAARTDAIQYQPTVARLSHRVNVPATAGGYLITDDGATFPRAEVARVQRADGQRGVDLFLIGDCGATFTPAEARRLADALRREADLAEGRSDRTTR